MLFRNISVPVFSIISKNAIDNLTEIIKEQNFYYPNVIFLTGNFGEKIINEKNLVSQFKNAKILNIYNICSLSKLKSSIIREKPDVIISIGGGNVNDIAKYLSMETSIPLISIPTILSNDGIASPISIIRLNGKYKSIGTTSPVGIIGDIDIIKKSPEKYILSGLGDLFSNITACLDWELSEIKTREKIDPLAKNLSCNASYFVYYNFLNGNYTSLLNDNLIIDLFNSLIMSAVSMIIAKSSRPASGSEHSLSHTVDKFYPELSNLHGLQVGFFTLFILYLHNKIKILNNLLNIYQQINFPIGNLFKIVSLETLIFSKAKRIRKRYTILNEFTSNDIMLKLNEFFNFID